MIILLIICAGESRVCVGAPGREPEAAGRPTTAVAGAGHGGRGGLQCRPTHVVGTAPRTTYRLRRHGH